MLRRGRRHIELRRRHPSPVMSASTAARPGVRGAATAAAQPTADR